jgi:lipopolysaccharide/colanic/teichoic acid biosynthesis glycosyltransferase
MKRFLFLACADLLLLLLAFGLVHLINYGHFHLSEGNYLILRIQILAWLGLSLVAGKFTRIGRLPLIMGLGLVVKIGVAALFTLSMIIVGLQLTYFSRTMVYGTVLTFVILETASLGLYQWIKGPVLHQAEDRPRRWARPDMPISLFILDGGLVVAAFFLVTYFKRDSLQLSGPYEDILVLLLGLWLGCSLFTQKFHRQNFNDFLTAFVPALKAAALMAVGLAFLVYMVRLGPISRLQTFGSLPIFLTTESFLFLFYVNYRRYGSANGDIEDSEKVQTILDSREDNTLFETSGTCPICEPVEKKLRHALEFFNPMVFEFLQTHIDLGKVDRCHCALMKTNDMGNLNILEKDRSALIINLHKLNDIRWVNRYLLLAHEKLIPGGYLVGTAHTITTHRDYYRSKYPKHLNTLFFCVSFVWGRVFPKLPWLKQFYFAVTKGQNRMVSRAEILGRLSFCGYKTVAEVEIQYRFYYIAQKIRRPSMDINPTYGPLVLLKRTGLGGRPITVYKLRTMYPFSEYIQDYVFNMYGTKDGDKIINDFRITGWGKLFRKLWIDELPMLYNFVKGDLKLVGVRPLSAHKLSTYPAALQEKRKYVKPGMLPPFYADRPKDVEGFFLAEERYLDAYRKRPVYTDFKYFLKIMWNIVVKKARSG